MRPTPEYLDLYKDVDIPLQPVTQEDLDLQPQALKALGKHNSEVDRVRVTPAIGGIPMRQRKHYLANAMTDHAGKIVECLKNNQLDENTIMFTSDHGDRLDRRKKWTMFEQVTRVIDYIGCRILSREINELVQWMISANNS